MSHVKRNLILSSIIFVSAINILPSEAKTVDLIKINTQISAKNFNPIKISQRKNFRHWIHKENRPNKIETMFQERRIRKEKRAKAKAKRRQYYNSLSTEQKRQYDLKQKAIQQRQLRRTFMILNTGAELHKVFGSENGSRDRSCTAVRRLHDGTFAHVPSTCP